MGERGPAPKRSDQRLGHTSKAARAQTSKPVAQAPIVPKANPKWHPVAKRWFNSLGRSAQSQWYVDSDWALAYMTAESMSREFSPQPVTIGKGAGAVTELMDLPVKAAAMSSWLKACSMLLVAEGDRRRVAIELQRQAPTEETNDVAWIDEVRARLRGAG